MVYYFVSVESWSIGRRSRSRGDRKLGGGGEGGGKELYAELSVQSTSERNGAAITVPRSPASD